MSGAVIFIPFYSQFHFSTEVEKTRKKVCLCANIYETEIWTASYLSPIYLKKFDFVGFFMKKQKTIK